MVSGVRPRPLGAGVEVTGTTFLAESFFLFHGLAAAVPGVKHAKWEGPPESRSSVSKVTRKASGAPGVGKTDLKAGLPRGLQGML